MAVNGRSCWCLIRVMKPPRRSASSRRKSRWAPHRAAFGQFAAAAGAAKVGELIRSHSGSDPPGVNEPAISIVIPEQQRADEWAAAFGVGPADDDKVLAAEAFGLDPQAATARHIGDIESLRNGDFEPVRACVPVKCRALPNLVIAEAGRVLPCPERVSECGFCVWPAALASRHATGRPGGDRREQAAGRGTGVRARAAGVNRRRGDPRRRRPPNNLEAQGMPTKGGPSRKLLAAAAAD